MWRRAGTGRRRYRLHDAGIAAEVDVVDADDMGGRHRKTF